MVDEVEEIEESQVNKKRSMLCNYKIEEDECLCEAWVNISLDAIVSADQNWRNFGKGSRAEERAIMWMDPSKMDEEARQYWEFTHGDILVKMCGGGGKGVVHGDSDGSA